MSTDNPRLASSALPSNRPAPSSDRARQAVEEVDRLHQQAEEGLHVGLQMVQAVEAHTQQSQAVLDQIKSEQHRLRDEVQEDVVKSLHAYDQWVGQMDDGFTRALRSIEDRIDRLQSQWEQSQEQIATMMRRSEALLKQSRGMVDAAAAPTPAPAPTHTPVKTSSGVPHLRLTEEFPPSPQTPQPIDRTPADSLVFTKLVERMPHREQP